MISFNNPRAHGLPRCHDETGHAGIWQTILCATFETVRKLSHFLFVLVRIATMVSVPLVRPALMIDI